MSRRAPGEASQIGLIIDRIVDVYVHVSRGTHVHVHVHDLR